MKMLLTCEHARNDIPVGFEKCFEKDKSDVISSHRGWDPGSEIIFHSLKPEADSSFIYPWTRLLIEPNRSLHNQKLFSEYTRHLSSKEKGEIIKEFYLPYRNIIVRKVSDWIQSGEEVVHVGVHTFTPVLNGKTRKADVAFLFDPNHSIEKEAAKLWKEELQKISSDLTIRFNYPYLGKSDGLATALRKQFGSNFVGLELEVNQKYFELENISHKLIHSIKESYTTMLESLSQRFLSR